MARHAHREDEADVMAGDPRMTADRGSVAVRRDGREIPRFAPNFSVYVLPPNIVCLYSEHHKFFLEGDLYAALAPLIAAGQSLRSIFDALEPTFSAEAVTGALKRLIERRFVLLTDAAAGSTAGAFLGRLRPPPRGAGGELRERPGGGPAGGASRAPQPR